MKLPFRKIMESPVGERSLKLIEVCRRTTAELRDVLACDDEGIKQDTKDCPAERRYVERTQELELAWGCEWPAKFPMRPGETVVMACAPDPHSFHVNFESSGNLAVGDLLASQRQRKISALASLEAVRKEPPSSCAGEREVKIQLSQPEGSADGKAFLYQLEVNGQIYQIRGEGSLNEEIAVCGAGETIRVKVSAWRDDLVFDDRFAAIPEEVVLHRGGPRAQAEVALVAESLLESFVEEDQTKVILRVVNRVTTAVRPSQHHGAEKSATFKGSTTPR
jgi:hypothetical protein